MRTVGAYEAKTHLSQLLEEVTRGERVAITKNGTPVALLVPVPSVQKPDAREVIRQLREFRRGITLGGLSVREMIAEGRRG
jgi:prevent-host-death family protein